MDERTIAEGEPISARAWHGMAAGVRAGRLIAGPGVRLNETPDGTFISFDGRASVWSHPFQVTLAGNAATIRTGFVNGIEPKIKGVAISGGDQEVPPRLEFNKPRLDSDGRGWIALEVTCGKSWEVLSAEVVQVADLDTVDGLPLPAGTARSAPGYAAGGAPGLPGRKARHPLAMLRMRKSGALVRFQITHFDLQHRVKAASATTDQARHFFFPAG